MKRPFSSHGLLKTAAAGLCTALLLSVAACSPKKNTAMSRNYQAFITRYNIYYNGDQHFRETLHDMETKYEDDYSQTLFVHPAEARTHPKSPQPSGNFDRSIEKAQKAIQLRSIKKRPKKKSGKAQDEAYKEWLKRGEYNPFLHNAWMMMGRSQFLNGDFSGAAATFYYISKHFGWLPATVTEARIWQARSYICLDWLFEAETILSRIKPDELTSKTLRSLYYLTYADFYIRSHDNAKAIPMLLEAVRYASGAQKVRLNFLLGQLYAAEGQKAEAYKAYKRAGSAASAGYRTKFNARIKQSEVYEGQNIEPEVKALKRMTRYDRNKEYLDQIYYAIGNLYLSRRDTANAIANYKLAAEKSTRNGIDRALSQLTLGALYFDRGNYDLAQPCYSEALPLLPEDYPDYKRLKRRSDVLDEMAVYSQNVTLQDSLLRLAAMDSVGRMKVIDKIIADLKKQEKEAEEAARREAFDAQTQAMGTGLRDNLARPNTFSLNNDDSWYFYNTTTRNQGKTEFQRKWGARKLEDDWRRRNKASFSMSDFAAQDEDDTPDDADAEDADAPELSEKEKQELERENDPHFPEYYLRQIPQTEEELQTANDIIQEGLYNIGLILKNKLADFDASATEFNRLNDRYPDNIYRLDVYYNMYLMYMQDNRPELAEVYRRLILDEFPDSHYAAAMQDPAFLDKLRHMEETQEALYAEAYRAYLENRNDVVHGAYDTMLRNHPLSKILPKFMFLHALAYVTENNTEAFSTTLKEMLERYPDTDMTPMASAMLKDLARGRQLNSGAANTRGMLWDTRLLASGSADGSDGADDGPLVFALDPAAPQLFLLVYDSSEVQPNALLFEIARHNFNSFNVRDFDLELLNFGNLGILVVKGFENRAEVDRYRRMLLNDTSLRLPRAVRPVVISQADFDLMMRRGASFEQYFRYVDETVDRATHEAILPPDEYLSAEEMYAEPDSPTTTEEPSPEVGEEKADDEPEPATSVADEPVVPIPVIPDAKQETKQESKQEPKQEPKQQTKQEPKQQTKPQTKTTPITPVVPPGSEGDDPLLDD